jgi:hypothetical protein
MEPAWSVEKTVSRGGSHKESYGRTQDGGQGTFASIYCYGKTAFSIRSHIPKILFADRH